MRQVFLMWPETIFLLGPLSVGVYRYVLACLTKNHRILNLSLIRASMVKFKVQK